MTTVKTTQLSRNKELRKWEDFVQVKVLRTIAGQVAVPRWYAREAMLKRKPLRITLSTPKLTEFMVIDSPLANQTQPSTPYIHYDWNPEN